MKNPYYYIGANPTVDLVIINPTGQILLVQRSENSPACPGMWALPGGFWDTLSKKGETWSPGLETSEQAAVREVKEESNLVVSDSEIHFVGVYEGNHRDPRDNDVSWSKSHAYSYLIPQDVFDAQKDNLVAQVGEVDNLKWHNIEDVLKMDMAFDHKEIIIAALKQYNLLPQNQKFKP